MPGFSTAERRLPISTRSQMWCEKHRVIEGWSSCSSSAGRESGSVVFQSDILRARCYDVYDVLPTVRVNYSKSSKSYLFGSHCRG